jgi:hypothetical protein
MDKITVAELATECSVPNQVVLGELKRLGLYVFSPIATIDSSFAETIRKKIQSQRDAEEARKVDAEKKAEAKNEREAEAARRAEKKALKKPAAPAGEPPAAAPEAPALRKAKKAPEPEEEAKAAPKPAPKAVKAKKVEPPKPKVEEEPHKPSLAPRKGRKHYDHESAKLVDATLPAPPPPIGLTPSEIAQKFLSDAGAQVEAPPGQLVEAPPPAEAAAVKVEAGPVPPPAPEAAKPAVAAARVAAEPAAHPGTVAKKFVVPKAKTKILMRTSAEKVVTPDITDRILRGLRGEKPAAARAAAPSRFIRKKKAGQVEVLEKVPKVLEFPLPPGLPRGVQAYRHHGRRDPQGAGGENGDQIEVHHPEADLQGNSGIHQPGSRSRDCQRSLRGVRVQG